MDWKVLTGAGHRLLHLFWYDFYGWLPLLTSTCRIDFGGFYSWMPATSQCEQDAIYVAPVLAGVTKYLVRQGILRGEGALEECANAKGLKVDKLWLEP